MNVNFARSRVKTLVKQCKITMTLLLRSRSLLMVQFMIHSVPMLMSVSASKLKSKMPLMMVNEPNSWQSSAMLTSV